MRNVFLFCSGLGFQVISEKHFKLKQAYFYGFSSIDKINGIQVMFFHSSSYGQNIRVKYYVIWIEVHFFHKKVISSGTDCNLGFCFCGLAEKKNSDMKFTDNIKNKPAEKSFMVPVT